MMKSGKGSFLLIILGILCILGALGLTGYNIRESSLADQASKEVIDEMTEQIETEMDSGFYDESSSDPGAESKKTAGGEETSGGLKIPANEEIMNNREMPTMAIGEYRYIGYISIPSLNLRLPVMDTWGYDNLRIAPCRYTGSYLQDNMVIAAHNYPSHFGPIRSLTPGAEVRFTSIEGTVYTYYVSDIIILNPLQTEAMVTTSNDWDLTLFTCTIGGQTRCTVRCVRDDFH